MYGPHHGRCPTTTDYSGVALLTFVAHTRTPANDMAAPRPGEPSWQPVAASTAPKLWSAREQYPTLARTQVEADLFANRVPPRCGVDCSLGLTVPPAVRQHLAISNQRLQQPGDQKETVGLGQLPPGARPVDVVQDEVIKRRQAARRLAVAGGLVYQADGRQVR